MAAVGANAALVTTPCFYKNRMNAKAMNKHYTDVSLTSNATFIYEKDTFKDRIAEGRNCILYDEIIHMLYLRVYLTHCSFDSLTCFSAYKWVILNISQSPFYLNLRIVMYDN